MLAITGMILTTSHVAPESPSMLLALLVSVLGVLVGYFIFCLIVLLTNKINIDIDYMPSAWNAHNWVWIAGGYYKTKEGMTRDTDLLWFKFLYVFRIFIHIKPKGKK